MLHKYPYYRDMPFAVGEKALAHFAIQIVGEEEAAGGNIE